MTKNNAGVVVPAIIACLVICALVLFTCKFCYNPRFLWRLRRGDVESSYGSSNGEKPPSGTIISHEVVSVSSSDVSSSISSSPEATAVVEVHPDDGNPNATVIAVAPNEPPVIEAVPPRESRFGLGIFK